MEIGGVTLGAGMNLEVGESDYLYGLGTLHLTIKNVLEIITEPDDQWVRISGEEKTADGKPWRPRQVMIRVSSLRKALVTESA